MPHSLALPPPCRYDAMREAVAVYTEMSRLLDCMLSWRVDEAKGARHELARITLFQVCACTSARLESIRPSLGLSLAQSLGLGFGGGGCFHAWKCACACLGGGACRCPGPAVLGGGGAAG